MKNRSKVNKHDKVLKLIEVIHTLFGKVLTNKVRKTRTNQKPKTEKKHNEKKINLHSTEIQRIIRFGEIILTSNRTRMSRESERKRDRKRNGINLVAHLTDEK